MSSQTRSQLLDPAPSSSSNGGPSRLGREGGPSTLTSRNQQLRGQGPSGAAPPRRASDATGAPPRRPSTAPGNKGKGAVAFIAGGASDDEDEPSSTAVQRPSKPPLLRSKSEHGLRPDDADVSDDEHDREPISEWGARHGFEDHYQSEDIISQLANVSSPHTRLRSPGGAW